MFPTYDLDKIKFATDEATFERAAGLYDSGKVTEPERLGQYYSALVLGRKPYRVSVSARNYKHGHCTCYLGQRDTLCKHMIALAIHAVKDGQTLSDTENRISHNVECGPKGEPLSKEELDKVKRSITGALRYIKPYRGPSRTWFANQDSLQEGCNRLAAIVSGLPVNKRSTEILVKLLLRLDRKLRLGGVDDSNGIVGRFMARVVETLVEHARTEPECIDAFGSLAGIGITSFQWEEPLVRIYDEQRPA